MTPELTINAGNSRTISPPITDDTKFFWENYFSNSFQECEDAYLIVNDVDLMGNPIKKSELKKITKKG